MSRQSHRASSAPDRRQELRAFSGTIDPSNILFGYLLGRSDHKTAMRLLSNTTAQGVLWAGELALEQAHKMKGQAEAPDLLSHAQAMFVKAELLSRQARSGRIDAVSAKAQLRASHLPIDAHLSLKGQLPPKHVAEGVYWETVSVGHDLHKEHVRLKEQTDSRKEISGLIGEISVLALLQRFAIQEIGSDSWFPFLSDISEDRRTSHGALNNHGWDTSIFTSEDAGTSPISKYRLQVKVGAPKELPRPMEEGITLVQIDPDLRIDPYERHIGSRIIQECFREFDYAEPPTSLTDRIDERTDKLLDLVDA